MNIADDPTANLALLAGEVGGALSMHFPSARLELDDEGNYTGRTLIERYSGLYAVRVEVVELKERND